MKKNNPYMNNQFQRSSVPSMSRINCSEIMENFRREQEKYCKYLEQRQFHGPYGQPVPMPCLSPPHAPIGPSQMNGDQNIPPPAAAQPLIPIPTEPIGSGRNGGESSILPPMMPGYGAPSYNMSSFMSGSVYYPMGAPPPCDPLQAPMGNVMQQQQSFPTQNIAPILVPTNAMYSNRFTGNDAMAANMGPYRYPMYNYPPMYAEEYEHFYFGRNNYNLNGFGFGGNSYNHFNGNGTSIIEQLETVTDSVSELYLEAPMDKNSIEDDGLFRELNGANQNTADLQRLENAGDGLALQEKQE